MMRIHTKALALSCGIVLGALIFCVTLAGMFFGYGSECLALLQSIYPGYSVSLIGSIIGLLYGFLTGAVIASFVGTLYNKLFVRI